jgi:O-antigen ligase
MSVAEAYAAAAERTTKHKRMLPASFFVAVYIGMLTLIPAGLVFPALGAAGTPATLFGIFLLLWWVCATIGRLKQKRRLSPVHVALGLLAVSILLSYASGVASGWVRPADIHEVTDSVWTLLPITIGDLQRKSELAGIRGLLSVAGWLGVALMMSDGLRSWQHFDRIVTTTTWLAAAIGLIGIIQYVTGENLAAHVHIPGLVSNTELGVAVERSGLNRVQATANHPIEYGVVLAALFPLAVHHALYRIRHWYDFVPAALLAVAVPLAVSRSGILVLAAAFIVLFAGWSANRRAWTVVLFPVVVVAMRAVFPGLIGTIRSLFTSVLYDPSVAGRTSDYGKVFELYDDHPLLGRGAYTFMPGYYRTLDNQFLMNLVELGAVGLVVTLWLFAATFYAARYVKRHAVDPGHQHLGLALSASLIGIGVSYATFDAWGFSMAAGTTFLLIGLAGGAWGLARQDMFPERPENA